jgi:hypothetical protein
VPAIYDGQHIRLLEAAPVREPYRVLVTFLEPVRDGVVPPEPPPMSERERAIEALRAAGLLTELGPEEKQRAAQCTTTLEEVRAALDRAGGPPLSELILEMRGPKE